MKFGIGRYRLRVNVEHRTERDGLDQIVNDELTYRDLIQLEQAEREYRDSLWRQHSILSSARHF